MSVAVCNLPEADLADRERGNPGVRPVRPPFRRAGPDPIRAGEGSSRGSEGTRQAGAGRGGGPTPVPSFTLRRGWQLQQSTPTLILGCHRRLRKECVCGCTLTTTEEPRPIRQEQHHDSLPKLLPTPHRPPRPQPQCPTAHRGGPPEAERYISPSPSSSSISSILPASCPTFSSTTLPLLCWTGHSSLLFRKEKSTRQDATKELQPARGDEDRGG